MKKLVFTFSLSRKSMGGEIMGFFDGKKTEIVTCSSCDGTGQDKESTYPYDWAGPIHGCTSCGGRIDHGTFSTKYYKGSGKQKVTFNKDGQEISREPYGSSLGRI